MKVEIDIDVLEIASDAITRLIAADNITAPEGIDIMGRDVSELREADLQIALAIHRAKEHS